MTETSDLTAKARPAGFRLPIGRRGLVLAAMVLIGAGLWLITPRSYLIFAGVVKLPLEFAHLALYTVWLTGTAGALVIPLAPMPSRPGGDRSGG